MRTRIGTILLAVPRHRNEPFRTMIFDNYSRSEAALISAMAEMVVNGVSTRRVSLVVEQLCGKSISKSSVSELCRDLDKSVLEFKNRPLQETYPLVIADATYFKVRVDHRVVSRALMIAIAFNEKGRREVIGFELYDHESKETWQDFFLHLRSRGLKDVKMITSDAHEGILYGISRVFPDTPWQRCQYHFVKNIIEKAPKKYQEGLRTELHALFQCADIRAAGKKRDAILEEYAEAAPQAMECLDLGFEGAMTVMLLPESMRRFVRTSNYLERLNRELKRRSTAIGVFPNESSVIRLMGSLLLEYHDKCQETQRMINKSAFDQLGLVSGELVRTAREQAGILAA